MSVTTTLLSAAVKQTELAFQAVIAVRYGLHINDTELADIAWRLNGIKEELEAKFESVRKRQPKQEQLELGE